MKTFKVIFVVLLIFAISFMPLSAYSESVSSDEIKQLSQDFFRLHIRANSDSAEDQALKLKVRDDILLYTTSLLASAGSKEESITLVKSKIDEISNIAQRRVFEEGYNYGINVSVGKEHFDRREYDGFFLPEGMYDSLIIEIGSGEGHNWWCVLYPCVCLSGATGGVRTDIEKVPNKLRTSEEPSSGSFKFGFWIIDVFKSIFG